MVLDGDAAFGEIVFVLSDVNFHRSMQREHHKEGREQITAAKAAFLPPPLGSPSAHPFLEPSLTLRLLLFIIVRRLLCLGEVMRATFL